MIFPDQLNQLNHLSRKGKRKTLYRNDIRQSLARFCCKALALAGVEGSQLNTSQGAGESMFGSPVKGNCARNAPHNQRIEYPPLRCKCVIRRPLLGGVPKP